MGGGSWTSESWSTYSTANVSHKSDKELFSKTSMDTTLDPKNVKVRESRDSIEHPNSTAIAIFLDQTGSMGDLSRTMIREGCNTLATELFRRDVIKDPQVMFGAIGDAAMNEKAPLQVSQYESNIKIAEQLQKFYLEGAGGGNDSESYTFPWYFLAMHSSIDCFEKRGKKGYLFTVGDECVPSKLTAAQIERYLGYKPEKDFTADELYTMVSRSYHVFHLLVEQGHYMSYNRNKAISSWTNLIGQNAILLSDATKMPEVIVSTIQAMEGENIDSIVASWDGNTSLVVAKAIKDIAVVGSTSGDIVEF